MIKKYRGPRLRARGYHRPSQYRLLRAVCSEHYHNPRFSKQWDDLTGILFQQNNIFEELPFP